MKQKLVQILKQFSKKKGAVAPCGEILENLIEQTQNQSNQINKAVESNVSKKKQDVSNPPNRTNVSKKSKTILPRQQRIDKFLNASSKKNADVNSPAKFSSSAKSVKRSLDQGGEESPNKWIASEQKEILNTGTQLAVTAAGAIRQQTTFIGTATYCLSPSPVFLLFNWTRFLVSNRVVCIFLVVE